MMASNDVRDFSTVPVTQASIKYIHFWCKCKHYTGGTLTQLAHTRTKQKRKKNLSRHYGHVWFVNQFINKMKTKVIHMELNMRLICSTISIPFLYQWATCMWLCGQILIVLVWNEENGMTKSRLLVYFIFYALCFQFFQFWNNREIQTYRMIAGDHLQP